MKLLIDKATGAILDASDLGVWQVPAFAEIIDWPGNVEGFAWPGGSPTRSQVTDGRVVANPAAVAPVDVLTADDLAAVLKEKGVIVEADIRKG